MLTPPKIDASQSQSELSLAKECILIGNAMMTMGKQGLLGPADLAKPANQAFMAAARYALTILLESESDFDLTEMSLGGERCLIATVLSCPSPTEAMLLFREALDLLLEDETHRGKILRILNA